MSAFQEIDIFNVIAKHFKSSETYLGSINYDFEYVVAEFNATCTEAFPFDPFDKVICALLEVEDLLSFEQIGAILGMNVGSARFKDDAEYEILRDALQSLLDFGMIESGDIDFNRCRLTPIGREYTLKKHKFKSTENKPFTLYFDFVTGDHEQAKFNYEFSQGKEHPGKHSDLSILDDQLKKIASIQATHIYNEEKLRSFKDAVLIGSKKYDVPFVIAFTFNIEEKCIKCYCLNTFLNYNPNLTNWINLQEDLVSQLFNQLHEKKYVSMVDSSDLPKIIENEFIEENEFFIRLRKIRRS